MRKNISKITISTPTAAHFKGSLSGLLLVTLATIPVIYFCLRLTVLRVETSKKPHIVETFPVIELVEWFGSISDADRAFLDGSMGNWFATILGLIAGVPIGLLINQKQQEEQEHRQEMVEKQSSNKLKNKVLSLVKTELDCNLKLLEELIQEQEKDPVIILFCGNEKRFMASFSEGGDLRWIDDVDLLAKLANAYYYLNSLILLEKEYSNPMFHQACSRGDRSSFTGEETVLRVNRIRHQALPVVIAASVAIAEYFESISYDAKPQLDFMIEKL